MEKPNPKSVPHAKAKGKKKTSKRMITVISILLVFVLLGAGYLLFNPFARDGIGGTIYAKNPAKIQSRSEKAVSLDGYYVSEDLFAVLVADSVSVIAARYNYELNEELFDQTFEGQTFSAHVINNALYRAAEIVYMQQANHELNITQEDYDAISIANTYEEMQDSLKDEYKTLGITITGSREYVLSLKASSFLLDELNEPDFEMEYADNAVMKTYSEVIRNKKKMLENCTVNQSVTNGFDIPAHRSAYLKVVSEVVNNG